jgi:hypothetical protein
MMPLFIYYIIQEVEELNSFINQKKTHHHPFTFLVI